MLGSELDASNEMWTWLVAWSGENLASFPRGQKALEKQHVIREPQEGRERNSRHREG